MTAALKQWLADFPSTNARIVLSLLLTVVVILTLTTVGIVLNRPVNEVVVYAVLTYLAVAQGLDVTQFNVKRKTTIVTPPDAMASNVTAETRIPAAPSRPPAVSAAPRNEVRQALDTLATEQRTATGIAAVEGDGD